MNKNILLLIFFFNSWCYAHTPQQLLSTSRQLIVVTTPTKNSVTGQMQRYERNTLEDSWKVVGKAIPIVVGKNGLGWDPHFNNESGRVAIKHEEDYQTPMGVYAIGPTFGFAEKSFNKMRYFPLTDSSVCVDDAKSVYYNKIIDSNAVSTKDWNIGEQMRQVSLYKFGAMVQFNTTPVIAQVGSCIFLHIWRNSTSGTQGCVAMEEANLVATLSWLDSRKNPLIAIFTLPIYKSIRSKSNLPF